MKQTEATLKGDISHHRLLISAIVTFYCFFRHPNTKRDLTNSLYDIASLHFKDITDSVSQKKSKSFNKNPKMNHFTYYFFVEMHEILILYVTT